MEITREQFEEERRPRFGNANPQRMDLAFWEWMIRGQDNLPAELEGGLAEAGMLVRNGMLKSAYGPYRVRDFFHIPLVREDGPIWTFDRMGATKTRLPDGRVVHIAGEHEDFYDPDFYIYNDVVVFGPNKQIKIYGYPKEIFPPTDFHTATLAGEHIIVVGSVGYKSERLQGYTPVYVLDLKDFHISKLETKGEMPGWISQHEAALLTPNTIMIHDGKIMRESGGQQRFIRNLDHFSLNVESGLWTKLSDYKWHQLKICRNDKKPLVLKSGLEVDKLLPRSLEYLISESERRQARISVEGVEVFISIGVREIEVIVEGQLAEPTLERLFEEIRQNAEAAVNQPCVAERF